MTIDQIKKIQPDEKGIIVLIIEGVERRYVKEKLLAFLSKLDTSELVLTIPKKKTPGRPRTLKAITQDQKQLQQRPAKKPKAKMPGPGSGGHRKKPVVAILPDGKKQYFPSFTSAAKEFKISKASVCHVIGGRFKSVKNISFQIA